MAGHLAFLFSERAPKRDESCGAGRLKGWLACGAGVNGRLILGSPSKFKWGRILWSGTSQRTAIEVLA